MATRISTAARSAAVDAITALLDAAATAGYIELRTGGQPANVGTAATGTLLATIPMPDPSFDPAVNGVADANAFAGAVGEAAGDAGWFRAYDGDDNAVIDGSVTATGGGGDMEINSVTVSVGVAIQVTAWSITQPGG